MDTRDYRASIAANVSARAAWEKIGRVAEWWNRKGFAGRANELGDTFTVRFGETWVDFEIVEAVPDRRVVWELEPEGERTRIRMTHRGLPDGESGLTEREIERRR